VGVYEIRSLLKSGSGIGQTDPSCALRLDSCKHHPDNLHEPFSRYGLLPITNRIYGN
jgi:hypothetical protein